MPLSSSLLLLDFGDGLSTQPRLALNSGSSHLSFLSAGIIEVHTTHLEWHSEISFWALAYKKRSTSFSDADFGEHSELVIPWLGFWSGPCWCLLSCTKIGITRLFFNYSRNIRTAQMQEEELSAERQVNSEFSFANICRILMVFQQQFSQTNMITVWYNPLPASHCSSCDTAQQPQPGGLHRHTGRWWTACSNSLGFALHSRAPSASRQGPQTHHRDVSRAQRCLECKRKRVEMRTGSALLLCCATTHLGWVG